MRTHILPPGAGELTYEIRAIVEVADKMRKLGLTTNMENIGDPIAKGEKLPSWIKEIVQKAAGEDSSYGYSPTRGLLETRQFLVEQNNRMGGAQIGPEDIIFFNGLGDAVQKIYYALRKEVRVLTPSPTYSAHFLGEAGHAGARPVSYRLNPEDGWLPDPQEIRRAVKANPDIAGILVINPDNPTGVVYPSSLLREIVTIAREHDMFLLCDEIYHNMIYNGHSTPLIASLIGDLPAISLKGLSKEVPWPGSRCGWIEIYNGRKDKEFAQYIQNIFNAKMVEVCSTTLPQKVIPALLSHPQYKVYLDERNHRYERYSNIAVDALKKVPGIFVNRTNGAFYMSVVFGAGKLNGRQSLPIENPDVRAVVDGVVNQKGVEPDKRFVYYLLGNSGICVVPLTAFSTTEQGFRITLLEQNEQTFARILRTLSEKIGAYLASA